MAAVETVRGPIDTAALGRVLMHEHVFVLGTEFRQNYPGFPDQWDEQARIDDAVQKLRDLRSRSIDTIVDPTVIGMGRYIPRIQRVNEQVDINIVAATGIYSYNDVPFQFHYTGPGLLFDVAEPMVELFIKDIREGIADTGVKAALLKCAIDEPGLTAGVERVMRAVGQAHVETGVPIMVHTNAHTRSGLVAQKVLAQEGVDLSKVVIGHSGDSADLDYLRTLADRVPTWGWTASASTSCCRSMPASTRWRCWPNRVTRRRWCSPTTRHVTSTGSQRRPPPPRCRIGTTTTLVTMCSQRCESAGLAKTRSQRCWSTTPAATSR